MEARSCRKINLEHENCASVDIDAGMAGMYRLKYKKTTKWELSKKKPVTNVFQFVHMLAQFFFFFIFPLVFILKYSRHIEIVNQSSIGGN